MPAAKVPPLTVVEPLYSALAAVKVTLPAETLTATVLLPKPS